jgi:hypothetical protein
MARLKPNKKVENAMLEVQILLIAAEVRYHLCQVNNLDDHLRGYDDMSEEDAAILDSAQTTVPVPGKQFSLLLTVSSVI